MWLSMFSLWGSLLTLVASQSCPDPSEHSVSWVRLKPLGQCKDEESTCPYRIILPPLTVQLPKSFREFEKMARELQSLTQMVNQLKEDCRECKEKQGMHWNIRTDDEGEDEERIQTSRSTINTKKRQQDIAKRESTVQVTTSRSAVEDTIKDANPTPFGRQRNTNQEMNINPHSTKPRAETNGGPKGSNPLQINLISRSKFGEVPSVTTTKKKILQSPTAKLAEASFPGDLDSEQPTQHEKHKTSPTKLGPKMNPSGTQTAKGKVKSSTEYHVDPIVTVDDDNNDDVETTQLQTPEGDKVLGERQLVIGTDAQDNRELEPNIRQLTRKQQDNEDKKDAADTGIKESRSNSFDGTNNGNVAKEGHVRVTQQPTLKNMEKNERNNHRDSSTKPKPLKPGVYSERGAEVNSRPVKTADITRGQKKLTSTVTGRASATVNVSQINPQTLEIKSKYAFKADTNTGTDLKSDVRKNSNPIYNVDTVVSGVKNSRSHNSDRGNVTAHVELINSKIQKSNFQTPFKPGIDAESNTGIDSNPVNGLKNSRLPISGITDGIVDVRPTNPQILDSNNRFTDSEHDIGIDLKAENNTETVSRLKNSRSPISGRVNATADLNLKNTKKQTSKSQTLLQPSKNAEHNTGMDSNPVNKIKTVSGQETLRSPISGIADGIVIVSPTNPQILDSKKQLRTYTDSETDAVMDSNPRNNIDTISGLNNSRSPISGRVNATADLNLKNTKKQTSKSQTSLKSSKDAERSIGMNSNPVNKLKDSRSPMSGRVNATADLNLRNTKKQTSKSQTSLKSSKYAERNIGMNSNPVNELKNSRSPISGITDGIVDVTPANPQIVHSKKQVEAGTDSESDARVGLNPVNNIETVSGQEMSKSDDIGDVRLTNQQILDSKNQFKTGTNSESDAVSDPYTVHNVATVSGSKSSGSSISDNSTADVDLRNTQPLNSQNPFTHGIDAKSNPGMDSHPFSTSEAISQPQMPNSPISEITDAADLIQTYPGTLDGTFKNQFKPGTDKKRKAEIDSNPLSKVETNSQLEMPQISITGRADATVSVNQINPQIVYSNSENSTMVSTPVNKFKTVNLLETPRSPISGRSHATTDQIKPQAMDHISKNLKPGTVSKRKAYPSRNHTTDTVSQRETSESRISDSRLDVSDTNPRLNSNDDLPRRQLLPKSKLNMSQPRNGWIKSSNPVRLDTQRHKTLRNNKTTSLRKDAITSGRHLPTGLLPTRLEKQKEITNQPERTGPTGISLSKDPRHKKPYISRRRPVNESKAFVSRGPKNTSGAVNYTTTNGTTDVYSKTVISPDNELNSMAYKISQTVGPTLAAQGIVNQAHVKSAKTAPAVELLDIVNRQIESTSQTTVTTLEKPGGISQQDLVLDTVNNIGRNSQPRVVEEKKGTDRRTAQTPFKTSSVVSNQENHKKPPKVGGIQILVGKMPIDVASSVRNELNYPTTTATSYTVKTEIKDKHSNMPQFTPPIITTTHFMDQDHAEQAKTTSKVKVSNKHVYHRLENPSQEIESKKSRSDGGNKELQSVSNGQGSSVVTDLQPNSLDSIQNRAVGSTRIIMDLVKASTGSKVLTTSTKSINENRDSNHAVMDKVEASTKVNTVTPSSDNAPGTYHRYSKTPLQSSDYVEGNNGGHSVDTNNGNSYPVAVNRMTGATLHKILDGHTNNGDNKKPFTVNNMDERQSLEKQLHSNCQGGCDPSPTPWSVLNSRESSSNDRDKPPQDCSYFFMRNSASGVYSVTPTGSGNKTFPVLCDMKSSGGGWTLIQQRFDGSISFNRTWDDYKQGFGNLKGEFWLGNDKIHWLTSTKAMVLRIELEDLDGIKEYAQYDHFHVANESQYYRLTIEGYSGTAGDAMRYSKMFNHNQKNFTTPDRDNDQYTSGNCGAYYSSGWWFDACMAANLNGKYYETRYKGVRNGIFWGTWHNISTEYYLTLDRQSFKTVRMMIRPRTGLLMD